MSKFKIGDKVTDGFQISEVIEIDHRQHGFDDYFIKWEDGSKSYAEENFIELSDP